MNKKLNDLLTIGDETKQLRINGAFVVDAVPVDKQGGSIEVSGT